MSARPPTGEPPTRILRPLRRSEREAAAADRTRVGFLQPAADAKPKTRPPADPPAEPPTVIAATLLDLPTPPAAPPRAQETTDRTARSRPRLPLLIAAGLSIAMLTGVAVHQRARRASTGAAAPRPAANAPLAPAASPEPLVAADAGAPLAVAAVQAPLPEQVARLERQAIERLTANDFTAARERYRELSRVAVARPEYAAMVRLLDRALVAGCGGDAPCAR